MDEPTIAILMVFALSVSSHQVCYNRLEYDINSNNPHRWVLPYEDPCEVAAVLGGMTTQNASHQQGAPYYLDKIALRLLKFFDCQGDRKGIECSKPLGLEDGTIPDESFSASSRYVAGDGRLNGVAWIPQIADNSWLEVDLVESTVVSGVITQGSDSGSWGVSEFKMKYKKIPSTDYYDDVMGRNGVVKVFVGNTEDATTPVTNMFDQSIVATLVRIEPVAFTDGLALRLELLGCHIN